MYERTNQQFKFNRSKIFLRKFENYRKIKSFLRGFATKAAKYKQIFIFLNKQFEELNVPSLQETKSKSESLRLF